MQAKAPIAAVNHTRHSHQQFGFFNSTTQKQTQAQQSETQTETLLTNSSIDSDCTLSISSSSDSSSESMSELIFETPTPTTNKTTPTNSNHLSTNNNNNNNIKQTTEQQCDIMTKLDSRVGHKQPQTLKECKQLWRTADCVCFDVDSTVCRDEAIDELARYVGKSKEVSDLTKSAMVGGLDFQSALAQRLGIIQPSVQVLEQYLTSHKPKLTQNITKLVELLHKRGVDVYLVSGGFDVIIEAAADELSIPRDFIYANHINFYQDGSYAGFDNTRPTSNQDGKARVVSMLKKTKGYNNVIMIGDGVTDLEACPPADAFIGFGGNQVRDSVRDRASWFVYNFQELIEELL